MIAAMTGIQEIKCSILFLEKFLEIFINRNPIIASAIEIINSQSVPIIIPFLGKINILLSSRCNDTIFIFELPK